MPDNKTDLAPAEEKQAKPPAQPEEPKRAWGPQLTGSLAGAFVAYLIAGAATNLGWYNGSLITAALWGGVIGGLIGGGDALANAGKRLTNKDARGLNIVVALAGMAVIFAVILGLVYFINWLVMRLGIGV